MAASWLPKKQSPLEVWANKRGGGSGGSMDLTVWVLLGLTMMLLFTDTGQKIIQGAGSFIQGDQAGVTGTGDGFEDSLKQTLKWEGSSCNNVDGDNGGHTCKGITETTYHAWLKTQEKAEQSIDKMTDDEMKAIYKGIWNQCQAGSKVMPLSFAVFDSCVTFDSSKIKDWFENLPANPIEACKTVFDRRIAYRTEKAAKPGQSKFLAGWLNRDQDGKHFCEAYSVPGTVDTNRQEPGGREPLNEGQLPIKQMNYTTSGNTGLITNPVQAAVIIYAGDGEVGSGAIVGQDGLVLTAAHVVNCQRGNQKPGQCGLNITLAGGRHTTATLVKFDASLDLALLKLGQGHYLAMAIAAKDAPVGTRLQGYGYGNPARQELQGAVQAYEHGKLVFNGEAFPGNSGGFLMNNRSELVGVIQARMEPRGNTAVPTQAASVSNINQFFKQ